MTERKRRSKVKAPPTEVFAMRLDAKLKYLAEISARRERRSLANFIEWAIEKALSDVPLNAIGDQSSPRVSTADKAMELWSPDEATRLVNLANLYPDLLTYEERLIWQVICGYNTRRKNTTKTLRFREDGAVNLPAVQACWEVLKPFALGTTPVDDLNTFIWTHAWVQFNELDDNGGQRG